MLFFLMSRHYLFVRMYEELSDSSSELPFAFTMSARLNPFRGMWSLLSSLFHRNTTPNLNGYCSTICQIPHMNKMSAAQLPEEEGIHRYKSEVERYKIVYSPLR